jgi:hypothetical protein
VGPTTLYREAGGVVAGAFQSEREEETRDRAERGSAVRGSDQASVAPKRIPSPTKSRDVSRSEATAGSYVERLGATPSTIVRNAEAEIFSGSNASPALFITPRTT